jgi:hypothetical protein
VAKIELAFVQNQKGLPEKGTPGHLYYVRSGPRGAELLLAARDGTLCPVTELFNLHIHEAPGRDGKDGVDGKDGAAGRDGKDGASIKGDKGDSGDVRYIGPADLDAALLKVKAELVAQRARFQARIVDTLAGLPNIPAARLAKLHLENLMKEIQ